MKVTRLWWTDEDGNILGPADGKKIGSETACLWCDTRGHIRFVGGFLYCDECFRRCLGRMR